MTLVIASVLLLLLGWRLGWYDPYIEERRLHAFDQNVLAEGEEVAWADRMERFRRRHPEYSRRITARFS